MYKIENFNNNMRRILRPLTESSTVRNSRNLRKKNVKRARNVNFRQNIP